MPDMIAPRDTYGRTIAEMGKTNPDIVVLDADLGPSTMVKYFAAACPEHFIEVGIAEANLIGIAAGLAASGKIPFASTFAAFASCRAFDQVRVSVAQSNLNVKIVATHAGITVGEDGGSHQALEDLALYGALPNFTIIVPSDSVETASVIHAVAEHIGPCYVRLPRPKVAVFNPPDYRFKLGEAAALRDGTDVTIIAIGLLVTAALEAADTLAAEGISARVLNMATVKPIDTRAVLAAAEETGAIVTAEEHQQHGGLGSIVAEIVAEHRPVPVHFVAIKDVFGQSGTPEELLEHYGLTAADIVRAAKQAISRKK